MFLTFNGHCLQLQMNDPTILANFLEIILQVKLLWIGEEITSFIEAFMNLLRFNKNKIGALIKETYMKFALRAPRIKFLTSTKIISGPKSVLFELKDRDTCKALPSVEVLNSLDAGQVSFMRKIFHSFGNVKTHSHQHFFRKIL